MFVGRRYRLYPTKSQEQKLRRFCGARRLIYNLALEQRELAYQMTGSSPGYGRQCAELKELRDDTRVAPWLSEIPMQVLQQALKDVEVAYKRFFEGLASYPRFKRKWAHESFRVPQHVEAGKLNRKWGEVRLQGLGWVKYRRSKALAGEIKHATVNYGGGMWHVSIQVETPDRRDPANGKEAVGIDRGVVHALATSNDCFHDLPKTSVKERERLLRLERKRERAKRGSRNRCKTKARIAKIHSRRAHRRHDSIHKATTILARAHGAVVLEALQVRNMTRSARGTVAEPGTNVAQKAGLNKAILRSGWGLVDRLLDYKCLWYGSMKVAVDAAYSSQECSQCGHTHDDNRKTQAVFSCLECGYTANADTNAAKVILGRGIAVFKKTVPAAGLAVAACGDSSLDGSVKQEPETIDKKSCLAKAALAA